MKNKFSCVFFIGVTALLSIFGMFLFCLPQKSFSETENRCLATFQKVSVSGFFDTSLQDNMTEGANDQFIGRDVWMKLSVALQQAIGFHDVGGVYFGADGYYLERVLDSQISENRYLNNLRCLEQFSKETHAKVTFLPVPSASTILSDKLPANAVLYDAQKLYRQAEDQLENVEVLDIRPELSRKCKEGQVYFKTDHHWTMEGAYQGYAAWCRNHKISPKKLDSFLPKQVSNAFYGTLYSKAPVFSAKPDRFMLPAKLPESETFIDGIKTDAQPGKQPYKYGIYDWEKLKTKDKYAVYFGGNFGRIDIHTNNKNNLLIIKDSFANSIVPFFMQHYQTITMLDYRYYNESTRNLVQSEQFDEILILYEMSNFAQDLNFFKILK